MMSHPFATRWQVTRDRLDDVARAFRKLRNDPTDAGPFADYQEALDHNEFEIALDALEQFAETSEVSDDLWELLAVAAESMELTKRAAACRRMKRAT